MQREIFIIKLVIAIRLYSLDTLSIFEIFGFREIPNTRNHIS